MGVERWKNRDERSVAEGKGVGNWNDAIVAHFLRTDHKC